MQKRALVHAPGGDRMAIIRPRTPEARALALSLVDKVVRENNGALLEELPALVEDYTFIGFMARTRKLEPPPPTRSVYCVVDADGKYVGEIEPGDSFVGYEGLCESASAVGSA